MTKHITLPEDVNALLQTLNNGGYEAYIVGGCVRDSILGRIPQDWDITTSALPEQTKALFPHTFDTGIQHGTITVVLNKTNYEITTYRIDGDYADGRHPDEVSFTSNLEEDLLRRDFTMNAIAYHPAEGFRDPFGGQEDISRSLIRGVGEPAKRFQEDALRMLRCVRFAAQLGFQVDDATYTALQENAALIEKISVERIHEEAKTEEKENDKGEKEVVEVSPAKDKVKINKRPVSLSDPEPLWMKHPNSCTDEEYKEFYRKVFMDYKEPLFWIHLNMDYPFNLKGILYFPKINTEYDSIEGTIKLSNNQVFIADNIKDVIPEFLLLLKGVIDCPDLPLNVSRSALQNDGFVKKISEYITKKVADKLTGMCKTDRESYEKYWDDISPFIKYGCIKDSKFSDKMNDYILFKNIDGKYLTLKDCIEENRKPEAETKTEETVESTEEKKEDGAKDEKEPEKTTIFYVTDEVQQSQYINMFREAKKDAVILKHNIDSAFISHLEQKDQTIQFKRIDADLTEELRGEEAADEETSKTLTEVFRGALKNDKLEVKVENLKNEKVAAMMTLSEESRRMQDMMKMYNMYGMDPSMFGGQETLVLNAKHPLVQFVADNKDSEKTPVICEELYDLAMLSHKQLSPEEMTRFVQRSNEILLMLTK